MSWDCDICGVKASFADPDRSEPPVGWTRVSGAWRCLACGRQAAVDAAIAAAGVSRGTAAATKVKQKALARFELDRDPDQSDTAIYRATAVPAETVRAVRADLEGAR